jgi:hypothetical protein
MPLKCQYIAAAGAPFNYIAHCGVELSISDKMEVNLMGQHCPIHLQKVNL